MRASENKGPLRFDGNLAFVTLTQGLEAVIDAQDAHLVEGRNWHAIKACSGLYYAMSNPSRSLGRRKKLSLHGVIMPPVDGMEIDHINGNGLDNRRPNLRLATSSQQNMNTRLRGNNRSGYRGVSYHTSVGYWRAVIWANGKEFFLGYYKTPEEAHVAYCGAAERLHGEFRRAA